MAVSSHGCLTSDDVFALVQGDADEELRARVEAHTDGCSDCRRWVACVVDVAQSRSTAAPGGSGRPIRNGEQVGRYRIVEVIGRGAMGTVYRATDPQLARDVAIKFLAEDPSGVTGQVREALALGRLSHPHVVPVFDVGAHDGRVFVVMALIEGTTLREAWVGCAPGQILEWGRQAAQGLQAAHRVGVVHRDFKPDNVVVDDKGRAHVIDFGLARLVDDRTSTSQPDGGEDAVSRHSTAGLVGTVAYMAPEQLRREPADPRSDQFALCTVIYEGLYGQRPFPGSTVEELDAAISAGEIRAAKTSVPVPSTVLGALRRGLAADPDRRFADLDELAATLGPRPKRGRAAIVVTALTVVSVTAIVVGMQREPIGEGPAVDSAWTESKAQSVRAAFNATGLPFASTTFDDVDYRIRDYEDRWRATYERITADIAAPDTTMARRMACLRDGKRDLEAVVVVFTAADTTVVENATRALAGVPDPSRCARIDDAHPTAALPEDPAQQQRVGAITRDLAHLRALSRSGKYPEALAMAEAAEQQAREVDYPPLRTHAIFELGSQQFTAGEYEDAEKNLWRAYDLAVEHQMDEVAADAAVDLTMLVGSELRRYDEAERWGQTALAAVRRAVPDSPIHARLLAVLGAVANADSRYEQAEQRLTESVRMWEQIRGDRDPRLADALASLGTSYTKRGMYDKAEATQRRALEIHERTLGPDHPRLALSLTNLGNALYYLRKLDEASNHLRRAVSVLEASLGPEHAKVAFPLNTLAGIAVERGELDEADRLLGRVIEIRTKAFGPDHPLVGSAYGGRATIAFDGGDMAAAEKLVRQELAIYERAFGDDHLEVARAAKDLGAVLMANDDAEAAVAVYERALAILEGKVADDHSMVILSRGGLGEALARTGKYDRAQPLLEQVVAACDEATPADSCAAPQFALARVLWQQPKQRQRAHTLAQQALDGYRRSKRPGADGIARWLAEHDPAKG